MHPQGEPLSLPGAGFFFFFGAFLPHSAYLEFLIESFFWASWALGLVRGQSFLKAWSEGMWSPGPESQELWPPVLKISRPLPPSQRKSTLQTLLQLLNHPQQTPDPGGCEPGPVHHVPLGTRPSLSFGAIKPCVVLLPHKYISEVKGDASSVCGPGRWEPPGLGCVLGSSGDTEAVVTG